jgi:hypothetical protein
MGESVRNGSNRSRDLPSWEAEGRGGHARHRRCGLLCWRARAAGSKEQGETRKSQPHSQAPISTQIEIAFSTKQKRVSAKLIRQLKGSAASYTLPNLIKPSGAARVTMKHHHFGRHGVLLHRTITWYQWEHAHCVNLRTRGPIPPYKPKYPSRQLR